MSLSAGTRLGPYLIEAPLGAGGMGEVYRALDTRLQRAVAIKVLAARLTADVAARERFDREARAVAALEHPNICALYDVGEHDGTIFFVMQYLAGETLAERLRHGSLPLEQALRHAADLAEALAAAHHAGIVHRDLKPGNIMVTPTGVQLLDFGLAKVLAPDGPAALFSMTAQETRPAALTEQGSLLGTLPYMAPEQLEGKHVDGRTDIFALGAVLYEMATGRRPFESNSQAGLIAAILGTDPPVLSTLRPGTPLALDRTVAKCLAKDPDARWQSGSDLADELRWIGAIPAESAALPLSGAAARPGRRAWLPALVLSALAAIVAWVFKPAAATAPASHARFTVDLPAGVQLLAARSSPTLAFSPDGRHLVYAATVNGRTQLFMRDVDRVESKPIAGTEGAVTPFFSPDGEWLGFTANSMIHKISMTGGSRVPLVDAPDATGATWGSDGRIGFAPFSRSGLSVVSANGGSAAPLTRLTPNRETSHRYPEFLPGARAVIFTAGPPPSGPWYDAEIAAISLDTGARSVLVRGGTQAHYVSSGHLVYARAGSLFAVPFDATALRVTGPAVEVLAGVKEDQSTGDSQFTVSANGSLAYVPGGLRRTEVVWVDRRGQARPLIADEEPRLFRQPRLSPDGHQLAISVGGGNDDVWVYDLTREVLSRFTSAANHIFPGWTPDGMRVVFFRSDSAQILWRPADRGGPEETILAGASEILVPHSWSPDGRVLLYTQTRPSTGWDIWALDLGDRTTRPILQTPFADTTPMLSPDGRWMAYTSDESGGSEIYVQPFPGDGRRSRISRDGGTEPLWAKKGNELFFRQGDRLMMVTVTSGGAQNRPQPLFDLPRWDGQSNRTNYDVTADGDRFVMVRTGGAEASEPRIHVVLNWLDQIKQP